VFLNKTHDNNDNDDYNDVNDLITILGSGANAMPVHRVTGWRAFIVKLITSVLSSSRHSASYSQLLVSQPDGKRHDVIAKTVIIQCRLCIQNVRDSALLTFIKWGRHPGATITVWGKTCSVYEKHFCENFSPYPLL